MTTSPFSVQNTRALAHYSMTQDTHGPHMSVVAPPLPASRLSFPPLPASRLAPLAWPPLGVTQGGSLSQHGTRMRHNASPPSPTHRPLLLTKGTMSSRAIIVVSDEEAVGEDAHSCPEAGPGPAAVRGVYLPWIRCAGEPTGSGPGLTLPGRACPLLLAYCCRRAGFFPLITLVCVCVCVCSLPAAGPSASFLSSRWCVCGSVRVFLCVCVCVYLKLVCACM